MADENKKPEETKSGAVKRLKATAIPTCTHRIIQRKTSSN